MEVLDINDDEFDTQEKDQEGSSQETKVMKVYVSFLLMFQTIFRLSDHGMDILFAFFRPFFSLLGNLLHCQVLQHLASKLPKNIRYARLICSGLHTFKQYYCCFKCHSIYPKEECIITNTNGDQSSISCSFI